MKGSLPNTRYPDYNLTKSSDLQVINKAVLEQMEITSPEIQKKLIGQFGIRNARQMAVFLKSPEGKAELAQIANELAILEKIRELNQQDRMDSDRRRKMLLAFFLFAAISRSEAKSKRLNAIMTEQFKKLMEMRKQGKDKDLFSGISNEVLHAYMSSLETIISQQQALNFEIAAISADTKALLQRYALYESSLSEIDKFFNSNIDELSQGELEELINKLTKEIELQTDLIAKHLEQDEDDVVRNLLNEQNAKNLKVAGLKDLLAIKTGERQLLSDNGEPVKCYKDSAYITDKNKTVIRVGDDLLLVNNGEEEEVKHSPERREQAKHHFLNHRAEMMPLRQLIKHNEKTERDILIFRSERVIQRQAELNQDADTLFNLINNIQAAQATMSLKPGAPQPQINLPQSKLHQRMESTALHYAVTRIEPLQHAPQHELINDGSPFNLQATLKNLGNNPALARIPQVQKELNRIDQGEPIPKELYATFLKLNNSYVNTNPQAQRVNAPDYLKGPADPQPEAPTPFSTTPRMGRP